MAREKENKRPNLDCLNEAQINEHTNPYNIGIFPKF